MPRKAKTTPKTEAPTVEAEVPPVQPTEEGEALDLGGAPRTVTISPDEEIIIVVAPHGAWWRLTLNNALRPTMRAVSKPGE